MHFEIVAKEPAILQKGISFCWDRFPKLSITHYTICNLKIPYTYDGLRDKRDYAKSCKTLVLGTHYEEGLTILPVRIRSAEHAAQFVQSWLQDLESSDWPESPGDCMRGFRLVTNHWGHVDHWHFAVVAIQPAWVIIPK